jgi:predicted amidophosphoribosyltransferase
MEKAIMVYTKRCKRCDGFFRATGKHSKICPNCSKPRGKQHEKCKNIPQKML